MLDNWLQFQPMRRRVAEIVMMVTTAGVAAGVILLPAGVTVLPAMALGVPAMALGLPAALLALPAPIARAADPTPVPPAPAPAPGSITCPEGQVAIGVPIVGDSHCIDNSGSGVVVNYLKLILQFLSTAVGGVVVLMIIIAGIQYIISNGDPKAIANAKARLINAITALVLFVLAFAILSFVVPGGIL